MHRKILKTTAVGSGAFTVGKNLTESWAETQNCCERVWQS